MKILIALKKAIDNLFGLLKVFINYISEGLHKEYADKGIVVQVSDRQTQSVRCMHSSIRMVYVLTLLQNVKPFLVATALTGMKKSNLLFANAISHARAAVATIGIQRDTYGCLSHAIQVSIKVLNVKFMASLRLMHVIAD